MFWRVTHDTLKWIGISFFPALVAVWMGALAWVDQYPANKPALALFYERLGRAMHTPALWTLIVVVVAVWLIGLIYSAHRVSADDRKTSYAGLADLVREIRGSDPDTQEYNHASVQQLEPPVLENSSEIFPPAIRAIAPLYVGQIIISAAQLAEGSLEIAVRVFNGSTEAITLASVHGAIMASINNAVGAPLPTPTLRAEHVVGTVQPGTEFMVVLDQPLPGPLGQTYLDALNSGGYIALDLRGLSVLMRAENDANLTGPLPLWHGASIRRRDDIFTNRIFMASVGVAVGTATVMGVGAVGQAPDAN